MTPHTANQSLSQRPPDELPHWHPRANWKPGDSGFVRYTPRGRFLLEAFEAERRMRLESRNERTIGQALDAMSYDDKRLTLAISKVDDESFYLRPFLPMARAARIVDRSEPWPAELLAWKVDWEERHYHGQGRVPAPPWLNAPSRRALPSKRHRVRSLQRELDRRRGRA